MVQLTRQDCAIASAGLMRSGLAHALHHARHRSVFQRHLADQPLMQAVLADMALHVEASIALVMRLCRSFDRAPDDANEAAFMRDLAEQAKGLPGAGEAVMFIANGFRRPDSERVARLAVEKLALLAAAAALNKVSPPQAELFAASRLANNHASMYGAVDLAN